MPGHMPGEGDYAQAPDRFPRGLGARPSPQGGRAVLLIRCDKPFGVRSAIDRVLERLKGKHWMYSGSSKLLDVIKMCEDCRVAFAAEENFEPYGMPSQTVRTTDDYLCERGSTEG